MGTDPAVLQLAGASECTFAQLVLSPDVVVIYRDSTGYTDRFIILHTEEQLDR